MNSTDGIIIQARTGSTRMPSKILLPFSGDKCILDILIERIKASAPGRRIVVATTTAAADSSIAEKAQSHGVDFFRGSEEDVLQRFIDAADAFGIKRLIRVCSDNPFLLASTFGEMFAAADAAPEADYIAYSFPDGRPTIKSHLGLFAEFTTTDALRRVAQRSDLKMDHEHVTIHMYTHPDAFKVRLLPLPRVLADRNDIRLTLDTPSDFRLLDELYRRFMADTDHSVEALLRLIDGNEEYGRIMKENITQNEK